MKKLLLSTLLLVSLANAEETTKTELSFQRDDAGNLNPSIFIPIYYGSSNQFYTGIGYTSSNLTEAGAIDGFSDSKNALVSSSKDLTLNYITYKTSLFSLATSIGLESTFSEIKNNEFGYIHDSADIFGNGSDYYISFDNDIELDIKRHGIRADIDIPMGKYITSRLSTNISPYTTIGVKQSTIFKPLVSETGTSSSSTVQELAYSLKYEVQSTIDSFVNVGLVLSYDNQPLKYDIAQLAVVNSSYAFETNTIDTTEVTTSYLVKLLFDKDVLGGLKPAIGFGTEYLTQKDNLSGESTSTDKQIVMLGFEKSF